MFLFQKIKDVFIDGNNYDDNKDDDGDDKNKQKKEKVIELNELKDEIWIQNNDNVFSSIYSEVEYESEHVSDEASEKREDDEYFDVESEYMNDEGNKKKTHFLEVPLFDDDKYGTHLKRNLKYTPSKKRHVERKDEEYEISDEEESSTDENDDELEEPFLDLYDELRKENMIREYYNPMLRPRLWCFEFFIKYIHNLEIQSRKNFYFITFGNSQNVNLYGELEKEYRYTPGYTLAAGEIKYLRVPLMIWSSKHFALSYYDLNNFEVTIEMWKINGFAFNSLYASANKTLKEIIETEPDTNITLFRNIDEQKISFETQRLGVYMRLSEVFEFHMALDSWWFISNSRMPSYLKNFPKFLRFRFPLNQHDWTIHSSYKSASNFWLYPGYFCFVGTHQQLANSFFIVTVLCAHSKYRYRPPILLGSCIVSLISVLEYPFIKGIVKKLTLDKTKFRQGEIVGNIKCYMNSYGATENEENIQRFTQPFSSSTVVNRLNLNEHYLIIRIIRCENLAINSVDINNVNVNVWVKWDGILNKTCLVTKTTSPYFLQNLYFPIRFTDMKELTEPVLIQNVLAMDLVSRGEICFEVHNCSEIESYILGIVELKFADIFNYGVEDYRSLDTVASRNTYTEHVEDDLEVAFRKTDFVDDYYDDTFMRKYKTIVYKNTLELMYSDLHLKFLNEEHVQTKKESSISFEAFVIPPLPSGMMFQSEDTTNNALVIYKSLSKRWEKDFQKFNDSYLQWFPKSIKKRRFPCISKNDFDNKIYPLCSFVTSLNLPAQVSTPGPLFHWLNNIEYIDGDDENPCFTPPYFCLSYRKGTVQDHALLLCSCLKGLEYDAYVCKGTINEGQKDHYWVMTRHGKGWVCFWEATNKSIIHLPRRWNNNNFLQNKDILKQNEILKKIKQKNEENYYSGEYLKNFIKFGLEELKKKEREIKKEYDMKEENELYIQDILGEQHTKDEKVNIDEILNNDEELFNNMFKVKFEKNDTYNCGNILKYLLENFSSYIPIAPKLFLLDYQKTLTYVPYSSIEIVFNENQVFGNLQNHHPACILYDFENNNHWRAFLNHMPPTMKNEITLSTPIDNKVSNKYAKDLEEEVREIILFMRNKEGLETSFDYAEGIRNFLEMYLDLCEYKLNLDNNYNPKPENYEWKQKMNSSKDFPKSGHGKETKENEANGVVGAVGVGNEMRRGKSVNINEMKTSGWSQYKNDYYPNIEAQYVNKEDPNFYRSYIRPNGENINKFSNEQKKQLTNIPKDYVYGMNEEVYNKGKEEYMPNYIFSKESKNILNYDTSMSKQNKKRFQHVAKHYRSFIETEKEDSHINKAINGTNTKIKNKKHTKCPEEYSYKTDSHRTHSYKTDSHETDSHETDSHETDLHKTDSHKTDSHKTDSHKTNSHKTDSHTTQAKIPNKFTKKYNKQFNSLKQLEKKIKKKQKTIKEELLKIRMESTELNTQGTSEKCCAGFIDTQDYLIKVLSHNDTTTEQVNEEEIKNLLLFPDYLKQISRSLFDECLFIPSKQMVEKDNEKKESQENIIEKNEEKVKKRSDKSSEKQNILPSYQYHKDNCIVNEKMNTIYNEEHLDTLETENTTCNSNPFSPNNSYTKNKGDILNKEHICNSKPGESEDREFPLLKKRFDSIETHKMYMDSNLLNDDNTTKFLETSKMETNKSVYVPINNTEVINNVKIQGAHMQELPLHENEDYRRSFEMLPNAQPNYSYDDKSANENDVAHNEYEKFKKKPNKTTAHNKIPLLPPQQWSRLDDTSKYVAHQISQWNWYYAVEEQYFNWQYYKFPVAPNHTFVGFPIHFSTTNVTQIKSFLLRSKRFENIMKLSIDKITFLIYCKVYPLIGGIMSNWVFLGCIVPWMNAQERETRMNKSSKMNYDTR